MVRFKHFVAASAALATLGTLAACAPDSGAKNGANGGGVFTTVDANNPITPGAPMNPYSPNGNTFLSYNSMRLGFEKKNPMDANDAFPGLAKSWETKGDTGRAHAARRQVVRRQAGHRRGHQDVHGHRAHPGHRLGRLGPAE